MDQRHGYIRTDDCYNIENLVGLNVGEEDGRMSDPVC